jgi:hypothetical protein
MGGTFNLVERLARGSDLAAVGVVRGFLGAAGDAAGTGFGEAGFAETATGLAAASAAFMGAAGPMVGLVFRAAVLRFVVFAANFGVSPEFSDFIARVR